MTNINSDLKGFKNAYSNIDPYSAEIDINVSVSYFRFI